MIHHITKFGANLEWNYNQESESQNPPLTYEAYNAAIMQYLYKFKNKVINIEKDIMKQGNGLYMFYCDYSVSKYFTFQKIAIRFYRYQQF